MKINEGQTDRTIRIIIGAILLVIGIFAEVSGLVLWLSLIVGAILLVTGIVGFCPLYALFKIKTNK